MAPCVTRARVARSCSILPSGATLVRANGQHVGSKGRRGRRRRAAGRSLLRPRRRPKILDPTSRSDEPSVESRSCEARRSAKGHADDAVGPGIERHEPRHVRGLGARTRDPAEGVSAGRLGREKETAHRWRSLRGELGADRSRRKPRTRELCSACGAARDHPGAGPFACAAAGHSFRAKEKPRTDDPYDLELRCSSRTSAGSTTRCWKLEGSSRISVAVTTRARST